MDGKFNVMSWTLLGVFHHNERFWELCIVSMAPPVVSFTLNYFILIHILIPVPN